MDIFTTAVTTTIAGLSIVATSFFGVNVANADNTPAPTSISTSTAQTVDVKIKPITVCGSGGLVPANAPTCPTKK